MYDVVIVGAGPSGCAAAFDLVNRNLKVLLLDRREFPRPKACAAGLTVKTLAALRYSVKPVIKRACRNLAVGRRMEKVATLESKKAVCAMSVRSELDAFCLEKTCAAGADFKVISAIDEIRDSGGHITMETPEGVLKSRFLIGADGTNSRVRKLTGEFPEIRQGLAIEGIVDTGREQASRVPMGFDFGVVDQGYGWVFPKDDHLNVGIYTARQGFALKRGMLLDYVQSKFGNVNVRGIVGDPMGMGGWDYVPGNQRVLLVGDAAGFVEPLTGEGLYNAVRSGQIAADAIISAGNSENGVSYKYRRGLLEIKRDLVTCRRAAAFFYGNLNLGFGILSSRPASYLFMKGYSMGYTLNMIQNRFYRIPFGLK